MSDGDRPARPDPLAFDHTTVPDKLRSRDAWVCWRYKYVADREEWTKVPVDASGGGFASSTDPATWSTFTAAVEYHEEPATDTDGVGFVVHDEDMVVGLDLDDCRDPATGDVDAWAADVLDAVDTYAEVSPSGTGLRLFGFGFVPDGGTRGDAGDHGGHIEMYETGRYLTVTGATVEESVDAVRPVNDEIEDIHAEYILDDEPDAGDGVEGGSGDETPTLDGDKSGSSDLDNADIVEKAKDAENGDKFTDLWNGRTAGYQSHSEARQALANLLAFWTGGDEHQMLQLFRQSDLCRGDDDERTFQNYEIPTALDGRAEYYDPDHGDDEPDLPNDPLTDVADVADKSDVADVGDDRAGDGDDVDSGTGLLLNPADVLAVAGLGEDGQISDLDDRQKAACVWDLILETDEFHVRVRRDNGSIWAYDAGVWKPEGERALRHAGRRALGSMHYGQNVLAELKAQARSDPRVEVESDEFGLSPGYVAVENGLVDLEAAADRDGDALRDLKPEDYALTQLPVEYDPDATAEQWKEFVGQVVEPSKIETVQEYAGYALHRGAMPYSKALLLVGSGSNGKTTFLNVVRALIGSEYTTSKPVHKFDEDNHVADLYGALANIDADLSEGSLSSEGIATFKRLVGGDEIDARKLYEDAFSFKPTAKHLYACNQVPDVSKYVNDHDIAFWRRWIIVEFPNYIPPSEQDEDLVDKLTTEESLSGVLNWAIDGWKRLRDEGQFTNAEGHDETRRRWQSWGESVEKFISECVERDEDADRLTTGQAFDRYRAWCRDVGADAVGRKRFTNTLKKEDVGYGRHRINGRSARGYDALGLSDEVPDPDASDDDEDDDGGPAQQSLM